jgi:3-methyladenine DNA glycosylase AlkD
MNTNEYYQQVRTAFAAAGNPDVAQQQIAYMKEHFEFYGLKMPVWLPITKRLIAENGIPQGEDLVALVRLCYADDHRELHYFALALIERAIKKQPADFIELLEELICTHSWWDSVDWIAKIVGMHFKKYPKLIVPTTERWMASGHMWLQRVCVIFQLAYRDKTDTELMFRYIRQVAGSSEFFLQKAAGWALRQHSRTDPDAVKEFVATTKLAPLTKREALRLMKDGQTPRRSLKG